MSKRIQKIEEQLKLRNLDEAQRLLESWVNQVLKRPPDERYKLITPFLKLAYLYRRRKNYQGEIGLLKRLESIVKNTPLNQSEIWLVERIKEAEVLESRFVPERGVCEMCDKPNRVLERLTKPVGRASQPANHGLGRPCYGVLWGIVRAS